MSRDDAGRDRCSVVLVAEATVFTLTPISRKGSHVKLRKKPSQGTRKVSVPVSPAGEISQDTYRSIADQ
jgi:hypothetical protein